MRIKFVFLLCLLSKMNGCKDNDFILDYFVHKKASSVVGFSCDNETGNVKKILHNILDHIAFTKVKRICFRR